MKENTETVRGYAEDLLACHRHVVGAMTRHLEDKALAGVPGARLFVQRACDTLNWNISVLEARIKQLGGPDLVGQAEQALTRITGFMAGVYGRMRGERASRMLRDNSTALSFLMVCSSMLHATAGAMGDIETVRTTRDVMQKLPSLLMEVNDLIPRAVVLELAADHRSLNLSASEATIIETKQLWRGAGEYSRPVGAAI